MPTTVQAIKKTRVDKKRSAINLIVKDRLRQAVRKARQEKSKLSLAHAYRELDMAAKKRVIHPQKAARLKSRLAKRPKTRGDSQARAKKIKSLKKRRQLKKAG